MKAEGWATLVMEEDIPIKKQIEKKKAAQAFLKNKESSSSEAVDTESVLDKFSIEEIFDHLIARVKDERSETIIKLAKKEYNELSSRITEAKARKAVGEILKEVIESKLLAAQGVSRIRTKN